MMKYNFDIYTDQNIPQLYYSVYITVCMEASNSGHWFTLHYKLEGKDIANLKNRGQTQGQDKFKMTPEERQTSPDKLQTSSDPTLPPKPTLIVHLKQTGVDVVSPLYDLAPTITPNVPITSCWRRSPLPS